MPLHFFSPLSNFYLSIPTSPLFDPCLSPSPLALSPAISHLSLSRYVFFSTIPYLFSPLFFILLHLSLSLSLSVPSLASHPVLLPLPISLSFIPSLSPASNHIYRSISLFLSLSLSSRSPSLRVRFIRWLPPQSSLEQSRG